MGGDHGHGPPYKIPDYRIYKVEDIPELMATKRALEKEGLKDPWLRNHVWKYGYPYKTPKYIFQKSIGRGMKWGFLLALVTTGIGYLIPDDHHGHGHAAGASHH